MKFYVSRQCYFYSGLRCIEIAKGGRDCAGADMLTRRYRGEAIEYDDPREAASMANAIKLCWDHDEPGYDHGIVFSFAGALGIEAEPQPYNEVEALAKAEYEKLPKCDNCGELLTGWPIILWADPDFGTFCDEGCLETAIEASSEQFA
jgi:hypothetical protein